MPLDQDHRLALVDDANMFELAPVSLWLEDASDVKTLIESWHEAGMTSLREWLEKPEHLTDCLSRLKILKVNRKTLDLFEAIDFEQFSSHVPHIVTSASAQCIINLLVQLWSGQNSFFGTTVNTTLTGRVLDVRIRGNLLPRHEQDWSRILVTVEDITDLEDARRALAASERSARNLFEHSPVALWVKDFSGVKALLDRLRESGVSDLGRHFQTEPAFAERCLKAVALIDVNRQAVRLSGAEDKNGILGSWNAETGTTYGEDLRSEILGLWDGKLFQQRDILNRTRDGRDVHVMIQLSVLSGHESDWSKVQIARTDISERKKAEARLRHLSIHEPLTGLYNRSFFLERLGEFDVARLDPVTILLIDLNGLKSINDTVGHAAGDDLLRRTGKILSDLAKGSFFAARIGGDEFAFVMPNTEALHGSTMIRALESLVALDNQIAPDQLSLAVGAATSHPGQRMELVVNGADEAMYRSKALFYAGRPPRGVTPPARRGRFCH